MTLRSFSTSSTPRRIHDPSLATFVRVVTLPGFPLLRPRSSLARTRPPGSLRPAPFAAPSGGLPAPPPVATTGHPGARFKSPSERRTSSSSPTAVCPTASFHARPPRVVVTSSPWW